MNRVPRISVVLPVYNSETTLEEAIKSILNQTEQHFQFIIIDDGSPDSSRRLIRKFADRDERRLPIFNKHQGIVPALNSGIEKAEGRYIARMDADDISHPQKLEKQGAYLDEHPEVGLISCLIEHLGDQDEQKGYTRYARWINSLKSCKKIQH